MDRRDRVGEIFDIFSLITNIPLNEAVCICADFLCRGPSTIALPFPGEVFIELKGIVAKSVSFSFTKIMYRQIEGVGMGSPLGPILANIFVGSKKYFCLKGFRSLLFIYVTLTILLSPLDHLTMHCYASINRMSHIHLHHLPWKKKMIINCHSSMC